MHLNDISMASRVRYKANLSQQMALKFKLSVRDYTSHLEYSYVQSCITYERINFNRKELKREREREGVSFLRE